MHIIKAKTTNFGWTYITMENISYFYYDENTNTSIVELKTGKLFAIDGNISAKLAKIITTSTNGNMLTLE